METPDTSKPIMFAGESVRAILDGHKFQTRRVITGKDARETIKAGEFLELLVPRLKLCRYGYPGGLLYVRETYTVLSDKSLLYHADGPDCQPVIEAQKHGWRKVDTKWSSAMFMPKALSRITLRITGLRVERLQDVTEEDAVAEGVDHMIKAPPSMTFRGAFSHHWDTINSGRGYSWAENPWVWAITFTVMSVKS